MLTRAFKGFGVSKIQGVQGSKVPRLKGFHGLNVFKAIKGPRASAFQGIEGFPILTGALKGFGVSKIQGFQGKYISNMSLAKNTIVRA